MTVKLSCNIGARRILLSGKIDEVRSHDLREALLDLEAADPAAPINLYIDTLGGSAYSMFSMYDALQASPCPIHTIGIGKVMSCGVLLLASGNKRALTPNTTVMMHQFSTEINGELDSMSIELAHSKFLQDRMYTYYALHTGQTMAVIEKDLRNDRYMTADEALKYGIVDKVLTGKGAKL